MAQVLLYHHIQGLTDGVEAFAADLRSSGHTVHTPDLFEGNTFETIEDGFAFARDVGFDTIRDRGAAAAEELTPNLVYVGFSFGVTIAQKLAQTRKGARGALLIHSCMPVAEYSGDWPEDVPVQIHGKENDEFFEEDLPAARELASSTNLAELFVYPGDEHLFTDSSLTSYDKEATALLLDRAQQLLSLR
jgi:dienelactone hydrolase